MDNRISANCFRSSVFWGPASDKHIISSPNSGATPPFTRSHLPLAGVRPECVQELGRALTFLGGQALQGSLQHTVTGPRLTPPQNKSAIFDPDSLLLPEAFQHPAVQLTCFLWKDTKGRKGQDVVFQEGGEAGREESPSNLSREESPGQKTGVRIARESRGKGPKRLEWDSTGDPGGGVLTHCWPVQKPGGQGQVGPEPNILPGTSLTWCRCQPDAGKPSEARCTAQPARRP